jgi:hypothetical protein
VKPVVPGTQHESGGDLNRLVAGTADLEECPVLVPEEDLLVVQTPRTQHRAIDVEERVAGETVKLGIRGLGSGLGLPIAVDDGRLHLGRFYSMCWGCDILSRHGCTRSTATSLGRDRA